MAKINDLDLKKWKEYDDILTDSLWLLGGRDKSGAHNNAYHGNFIPQIPHQMMRRFTQAGDVVLDAFLGHGTTLIEAKRLRRHGIGIELMADVAASARHNIAQQSTSEACIEQQIMLADSAVETHIKNQIVVADSAAPPTRQKVIDALEKIGKKTIDLILLHPPYHDIIKFSDEPADLSNQTTVAEFTEKFGDVIANFYDLLAPHHYLAIVIGDKYSDSEWVPLGFRLMEETIRRAPGLKLKSILVKNMANNRAKLQQGNLWRYRALLGGFYIFKHEYILVFKKS